jgi:lipid-binding SYLF domain-containing protein
MMRLFTIGVAWLACAVSASALDSTQLNERLRTLTDKFETLQQTPDKRVPADLLGKARGVILLDRTKAGFIFAFQGGGGVAMVKDKNGEWSPPAFLTANEASLGFQIGGEQDFYVILLMTTNAVKSLTDSTINFGGEARGTAGNDSSGVEGDINSPEHSVIVYDSRQGLFGGVSIKGGTIAPDEHANEIYYNQAVSMRDILFDRKVSPTAAATDLAKKISDYSKK